MATANVRQWFVFARCDDGLKVVLEGVANPERVDTWECARRRAAKLQCDPNTVFILPYDEAMRTYGEVVRNHFHLREIELQKFRASRGAEE